MRNTSILLAIIFLISFTTPTKAQDKSRTWGISAAFQESQLDLLFPIWTGETNIIAPSVGIINIGGSGTDLRFGLLDRIFLNNNEKIRPFLGARFGVLLAIQSEGESVTDFVAGILGGGEYFFSNHFSIGVEGQLNFSKSNEKSNRFGNPGGTNINTASAIYAAVYF